MSGRHDRRLDERGRILDPVSLLTAWQEDLRAWAALEACEVRLWLQPHASRAAETQDWGRYAGSRMLDALAGGRFITAEALHCLAARVGLFDATRAKRYPADSVVCEASLHAFVARDYRIRHALPRDLDRLCELESLCWRHTRSAASTIRARIEDHPAGQFVLERDGRVQGVVYSQRIDSADAVFGRTAADVHLLHRADGPVVQLLAVNVDPEVQDQRYGDALLEFMLQRCSLVSGVRQVVGVTLCKRYEPNRGESFERYIRRSGAERDPILTFHHAHGADIVGPVPGYRPEDAENECNGVLVSYDILRRDARLRERERIAAEVVDVRARIRRVGRIRVVVGRVLVARQQRLVREVSGVVDGRPVHERAQAPRERQVRAKLRESRGPRTGIGRPADDPRVRPRAIFGRLEFLDHGNELVGQGVRDIPGTHRRFVSNSDVDQDGVGLCRRLNLGRQLVGAHVEVDVHVELRAQRLDPGLGDLLLDQDPAQDENSAKAAAAPAPSPCSRARSGRTGTLSWRGPGGRSHPPKISPSTQHVPSTIGQGTR